MAESLEISYNSLHNYQSVAKAYPTLDMRMSSVSFYHYQIAAPLDDRLEVGRAKCYVKDFRCLPH